MSEGLRQRCRLKGVARSLKPYHGCKLAAASTDSSSTEITLHLEAAEGGDRSAVTAALQAAAAAAVAADSDEEGFPAEEEGAGHGGPATAETETAAGETETWAAAAKGDEAAAEPKEPPQWHTYTCKVRLRHLAVTTSDVHVLVQAVVQDSK